MDASNSVRDRFRFEQESAIEFLNQIVRPKSDRAFVIGFDTTAEVTQDFTDSAELLSRGVRMLRPGGGTALYDAIYYACRDKLMKARPHGPARRAIILLSDGEDNQSRVTREEAIEMAQRAEVIIYTISTNISGVKLRGDKVLERLADATGGRAFFPFKIQDVANAFSEIQDELRSQYLLAYKPADLRPMAAIAPSTSSPKITRVCGSAPAKATSLPRNNVPIAPPTIFSACHAEGSEGPRSGCHPERSQESLGFLATGHSPITTALSQF